MTGTWQRWNCSLEKKKLLRCPRQYQGASRALWENVITDKMVRLRLFPRTAPAIEITRVERNPLSSQLRNEPNYVDVSLSIEHPGTVGFPGDDVTPQREISEEATIGWNTRRRTLEEVRWHLVVPVAEQIAASPRVGKAAP